MLVQQLHGVTSFGSVARNYPVADLSATRFVMRSPSRWKRPNPLITAGRNTSTTSILETFVFIQTAPVSESFEGSDHFLELSTAGTEGVGNPDSRPSSLSLQGNDLLE